MNKKSIKVLLPVEGNPADVRLLREMFHEQSSHRMEWTQVDHGPSREACCGAAGDMISLELGLQALQEGAQDYLIRVQVDARGAVHLVSDRPENENPVFAAGTPNGGGGPSCPTLPGSRQPARPPRALTSTPIAFAHDGVIKNVCYLSAVDSLIVA